jgi:YidC/Oxa1 family membrane protein insertase
VSAVWDQFIGFFTSAVTTLADAFGFLGSHKWAAAIVALTIIVKLLTLPLAIKQIRSMRETQRLQPEMQRIRQKYRNDRQKQMQETQALYQREGINPLASCLPIIAQMPVFIGMYQALGHLPNVAMPFLGLGDLQTPASKSVAGWVLIVIMVLAQLLATLQLNPGQNDSQKRMQLLLPIVFVFLFINFKAALVLYWATQSTFQLVQQVIMTRDMRREAGGWKALMPWGPKPDPKAIARQAKLAAKQPQASSERPKPQVREPAVVSAGGSDGARKTADPLASRRSLDEKRARRRRNKKRRKR